MSSPLPWRSPADRRLFAAVFAKDDLRALSHAKAWFDMTRIEDFEYDHHRLIAAVGRRFPHAPGLAPWRQTIANVSKQLWIRATDNLRSLAWVSGYLTDLHVPWAYIGNLAWQDRSETLFKDCDLPELMIAAEAYPHVVVTLWRNGWAPPEGTDIYDVSKALHFRGPSHKSLKIWSDDCLPSPQQLDGPKVHWRKVRMQQVFHATHPVLDLAHLRCHTLQRDMDDMQWLIDLKHISDKTGSLIGISGWAPGADFKKRRTFRQLLNG